MNSLKKTRLELCMLLDNCDGCKYQSGRYDSSANLRICQNCTNYKAMQRKRKEIEHLQAINRRGGLVSR